MSSHVVGRSRRLSNDTHTLPEITGFDPLQICDQYSLTGLPFLGGVTPLDSVLQAMISALELEVNAIRSKGGKLVIELGAGERKDKAGGSFIYVFRLTEELQLRDDTPVRVTIGADTVDGTIVSIKDGSLVLALNEDMGPRINSARIVIDEAFLIEKLKEALQDVAARKKTFNFAAAGRVLGDAPIRSGDAFPDPIVVDGDLNELQKIAISRALGSDTTYLWGPPGTGKTTVLARIVEGFYRRGLSVLVVSNTNIAVDTALEKISDRLKKDAGFREGRVLRFGPVVKGELEERYGSFVTLDKVVQRLGATLAAELEVERGKITSLEEQIACIQPIVVAWVALKSDENKLIQVDATLAKMSLDLSNGKRRLEELGQQLGQAAADLDRAAPMGPLVRLLSGLNINALTKKSEELSCGIKTLEAELRKTREAYRAVESGKPLLIAGIESRRRELSNQASFEANQPRLRELDLRLQESRARVADLEARLARIKDDTLAKCQVVATTVYRTYLKGQVDRHFDVVVVDEASMLMLPMVFYASGLSTQAIVIAGDFRQLPAIVVSREPKALTWLKTDIFHKAGIVDKLGEGLRHLVALCEQHRMAPEICAMVSDFFYYDNELLTGAEIWTRKAPPTSLLGTSPVSYVNTGAYNPWSALKLGTYSRYNLFHALLLRNMAIELSNEENLDDTNGRSRLGILSPYSAQRRLVQALLNEALEGRGPEICDTVHRFQGNEKDFIILDIADSIGTPLSRFIKGESDEDGARIINVALSRPRHNLILVANLDHLKSKLNERAILGQVIERFEKQGSELDIGDILPYEQESWKRGLRDLEEPYLVRGVNDWGYFDERSFNKAFAADCSEAEQSITIFSPFITLNGASRWADILRAAILRGARVRVVTRPPDDQGPSLEEGAWEAIEGLEDLGVKVDLRQRMHQKVAFIDDNILWHGSLNILSHRDTAELMERVKSKAAIDHLSSFLSTPTRGRKGRVDISLAENPSCPACHREMIWKNGRFGIYYECADSACGHKLNPLWLSAGKKKRAPKQISLFD